MLSWMLPYFKNISDKKALLLIGCAWILLAIFLFITKGIETGLEASKYIEQANNLVEGKGYSTGNFIFYSVPILLIAGAKVAGLFPIGVVIIQLLLATIAIGCFYYVCRYLQVSSKVSVIFTLLFLIMVHYHLYHIYLFSESIFYSLSIIYTYYLVTTKKILSTRFLFVLLCLLILYFSRPVAIFFIPATLLFLTLKFQKKRAVPILITMTLLGVGLLYILLNYALGSGGEFDFALPYIDERVICGVPTFSSGNNIVVPGSANSIEGLWFIITNHTDLFLRLGVLRFKAFWGMTRTYYSEGHNLFLMAYFYPLYILMFAGIRKMKNFNSPFLLYLLCPILFTTITVVLSCDEWHNRFILALLPFFLWLAAAFFREQEQQS